MSFRKDTHPTRGPDATEEGRQHPFFIGTPAGVLHLASRHTRKNENKEMKGDRRTNSLTKRNHYSRNTQLSLIANERTQQVDLPSHSVKLILLLPLSLS